MNALRDDIYQTLQKNPTYSLEALAAKYRTSEAVIKVQLDRMKEEGRELPVSDEEACVFLDHTRWFWVPLLWILIGLIFTVAWLNGIEG